MEAATYTPLTAVESARMSAERSRLYNEMRRTHLLWRGWSAIAVAALLVLALGLTAAALVLAFLLAVYGVRTILDARAHGDIANAFSRLVDGTWKSDFVPSSVAAESARLWAREPAAYHAVNALAYNAVQDSHGRDPASKLAIPRWRVLTAHWLPWTAGIAAPRAERGKDREDDA